MQARKLSSSVGIRPLGIFEYEGGDLMDVGRLNSLFATLEAEIASSKVIEKLGALQTAISAAVTTPTPEAAQLVRTSLDEIISALGNSATNDALPTDRMILDETGSSKYFGMELLARIQDIVSQMNLTPQQTVQELAVITKETSNFYKVITRVRADLALLRLADSSVSPGTAELTVSIPKDAFDPSTTNFGQEYKKVNYILETFNELATDNQEKLTIKKISSSEWQFYIECAFAMLVIFPIAAEKILNVLNKYVDYKKKVQDLQKGGFPEATIKPLLDHLEQFLPEEREKIAKEMVDAHAITKDEGRKNELVGRVKVSLAYFIDFRARGTTFEIRAFPPEPPKSEEANSESSQQQLAEYERHRKLVEDLNAKGRILVTLPAPKDVALLPKLDGEESSK